MESHVNLEASIQVDSCRLRQRRLFFVYPAAGLLTMALWFGIGAIVYGALQLVAAFRLRGHRLAA